MIHAGPPVLHGALSTLAAVVPIIALAKSYVLRALGSMAAAAVVVGLFSALVPLPLLLQCIPMRSRPSPGDAESRSVPQACHSLRETGDDAKPPPELDAPKEEDLPGIEMAPLLTAPGP